MNIKHGDIITLDNGDKAKVSLEMIETVTELIVNKKYQLQYSGQFCHIARNGEKITSNEKDLKNNNWLYVGRVTVSCGDRYIFLNTTNMTMYLMFTTANLNFVVKEVN